MEMDNVASSRQPIENLMIDDKETFAAIFDKFDMFREMTTNDWSDAVKFAYLEHLLRLSTDPSETETAISKLFEPARSKISAIFNSRIDLLQGVIHGLDTLIFKPDLASIQVEMVNFNYIWTGSKLNTLRTDFVDSKKADSGKTQILGINYTFSFKSKVYILYTPQMTYIDGFDPFTASTKIPLLTQGMIKGMSKDFYTKVVVSVQIQTESNAKRVDTRGSGGLNSPRSSVRSDRKGEMSSRDHIRSPIQRDQIKSPVPRDSLKSNSPNPFEDNKPINEDNQSITEDVLDQEDDEEEENNESIESSFEQNLETKKPAERTWEKFQKRAIEKQKERDQCGPGDCEVF